MFNTCKKQIFTAGFGLVRQKKELSGSNGSEILMKKILTPNIKVERYEKFFGIWNPKYFIACRMDIRV
jgi:hypothetical protein